jgi:hypothetical protein
MPIPPTVTMPTFILVLLIGYCVWITWRDDFPHKNILRKNRKHFTARDINEYVDALIECEKSQEKIYELN